MYHEIFHMTPYLPARDTGLLDRAVDIIEKSAALAGALHPITRQGLTALLQITNTYYSNLIEAHHTHPVDIERAMAHQYDHDPAKRDLQIEAKRHVELARDIERQLGAMHTRPTETDFICSIHQRFYENLPNRFKKPADMDGQSHVVVSPGEFRGHHVKVGYLIPVEPEAIGMFMAEFEKQYDLNRFGRSEKLLAIAAAHHRLVWIHPFSDGNGRVARLFSDACMKAAGITGYGLWTISRGFARYKADYLAALAAADAHRRGDLDGRGNLSQKGLNRFCEFYIETCLDQIRFMENLLDLEGLLPRIAQYIHLRANRLIPGAGPLRPEALHLIREAFVFGQFPRGQAARISGLKERTARTLLSQLAAEKLLVSDTPKGPVRLHFSASLLPVWFPGLGPGDET